MTPTPDTRRVTLRDIASAVAAEFGVRVTDLAGRQRYRRISEPRQAYYYLAHKLTGYGPQEIAAWINKDRTSAVKGIERIESRLSDRAFAARLRQLEQRVAAYPSFDPPVFMQISAVPVAANFARWG